MKQTTANEERAFIRESHMKILTECQHLSVFLKIYSKIVTEYYVHNIAIIIIAIAFMATTFQTASFE